ncbi:hypothetical protein PIB30_036840 [Stylosanthes scabra]|uniref:Uncharacterized protein n=1 Tax=Stylosanthes scabra TaxID=79078 RepID=A0ABU6SED4_9FABA|nr:hypothetical protein [Stylosanthes scabra]
MDQSEGLLGSRVPPPEEWMGRREGHLKETSTLNVSRVFEGLSRTVPQTCEAGLSGLRVSLTRPCPECPKSFRRWLQVSCLFVWALLE